MNAVRVETTVLADGELHLSQLPCRRGDRVEAIILLLDSPKSDECREQSRAEALERFLTLARSSLFRSEGTYPSRDELYERS